MAVNGKLEVTIKFSQFPTVQLVENGWKRIEIDCGGRIVSATFRPKMFNKLETAAKQFPEWVASVVGQIGASTPTGFILDNPSIQVFEKKQKPAPEPTPSPDQT